MKLTYAERKAIELLVCESNRIILAVKKIEEMISPLTSLSQEKKLPFISVMFTVENTGATHDPINKVMIRVYQMSLLVLELLMVSSAKFAVAIRKNTPHASMYRMFWYFLRSLRLGSIMVRRNTKHRSISQKLPHVRRL
jgi:hypothetical protein